MSIIDNFSKIFRENFKVFFCSADNNYMKIILNKISQLPKGVRKEILISKDILKWWFVGVGIMVVCYHI